MSNWFVFYVQTGKEQTACNFLNKLFDEEESVAFVPQVELIYRTSKVTSKYLKPMFPGYVIAESIIDGRLFITQTYKYARFSKCIFKLLGKNNLDYMKLSDYEKDFLLSFCDDEYIVGDSVGFILGDKVFVTSGPLKGNESIIRKIDRHKRRAKIELDFMGDSRIVDVALEVVSKL